ncbi:MAG: Ig-like domain-containing protein [Candidatus Choladocola sp.]|nr:Ig-like domain-containing protein [Candidatus Choladocola sp.]
MKKRLSMGMLLMTLILMLLPVHASAATSIKLNKTAVSIYKGTSVTLKATVTGTKKTVKWTSGNKSVATVSKGKVTAKKAGKVTITASVNGVKKTCAVTVKNPYIKLNTTSKTIYEDGTATLKVTVKGPKKTVSWASSNPKVATVKNGRITAKGQGTATITATANGVKSRCTVTVKGIDYKNLYYEFLKKAETSFSYKEGLYTVTAKAKSFYLMHLNSDKTPELIVSQNPSGSVGPEAFWVFTIKNNKVVYCGSVSQKDSSEMRYNTKYNALYTSWWTNGAGGAGEALWRVNGTKLQQYKYAYAYYENGKRIYKTGTNTDTAVKVSASKSTSFHNTYFNSNNIIKGTRLRNTESVRLSRFK